MLKNFVLHSTLFNTWILWTNIYKQNKFISHLLSFLWSYRRHICGKNSIKLERNCGIYAHLNITYLRRNTILWFLNMDKQEGVTLRKLNQKNKKYWMISLTQVYKETKQDKKIVNGKKPSDFTKRLVVPKMVEGTLS